MKYLMPHNAQEQYIKREIEKYSLKKPSELYRIEDIDDERALYLIKQRLEQWGVNPRSMKHSTKQKSSRHLNSKDLLRISTGRHPEGKTEHILTFEIGAKYNSTPPDNTENE